MTLFAASALHSVAAGGEGDFGGLRAVYMFGETSLVLVIRLEARIQSNIGITLGRVSTVFTRSAEGEPIWIKSGDL